LFTLWSTILLFNSIAFIMKKKINGYVYYTTIYFGLFFAVMFDKLTDKYKTYGFFQAGIIDPKELSVIFGIYPATAMMIINWFPYKRSFAYKTAYILGWSAFSTFYQWLATISGFFQPQNWKLWYSALLYPLIYGILILHVYFIHWLFKKERRLQFQ